MGTDLTPMPSHGKGYGPELRRVGGEGPDLGQSQRIQIIKGWTQNGQSFEKIYDVAGLGASRSRQVDGPRAGNPKHCGH